MDFMEYAPNEADSVFIANAPQDVRALLEHIYSLNEELLRVSTILRDGLSEVGTRFEPASAIAERAARRIQGQHADLSEADQILGKALGYPAFPEGGDWVSTGEHSLPTLALEAADTMARLESKLGQVETAKQALSTKEQPV